MGCINYKRMIKHPNYRNLVIKIINMKTAAKNINKTCKALILLMTIFTISQFDVMAKKNPRQNEGDMIFISGKIKDKETGKPVTFANVYLVGTHTGTVANSDGEFLLKVPKDKAGENIGITHLGYKNFSTSLTNFNGTIVLEPELVPLQEIIVRSEDPLVLLRGAMNNINKNYRTEPSMMTCFYREAIQQNRKYVAIAEAVLDAYKTSYTAYTSDRVKIIIGRKSQDVKKMDTVIVKLQGGPITPFYLDIVKNPEGLLTEEYFNKYNYKLVGMVTLGNNRCYVIEFNQKQEVNEPLYAGKIYLDADNLAIAGLEFQISEYGLPMANSLFLMKKPLTLKFETLGANYFVRYTENAGKWDLNYVRSELRFRCKWQKHLFKSNYLAMVEMAVTDIDTANLTKFAAKETTKKTDIFSDEVTNFENTEYWGDYNIIKPDENIQAAIDKLGKKLKKK
jgi:hypothetical protein